MLNRTRGRGRTARPTAPGGRPPEPDHPSAAAPESRNGRRPPVSAPTADLGPETRRPSKPPEKNTRPGCWTPTEADAARPRPDPRRPGPLFAPAPPPPARPPPNGWALTPTGGWMPFRPPPARLAPHPPDQEKHHNFAGQGTVDTPPARPTTFAHVHRRTTDRATPPGRHAHHRARRHLPPTARPGPARVPPGTPPRAAAPDRGGTVRPPRHDARGGTRRTVRPGWVPGRPVDNGHRDPQPAASGAGPKDGRDPLAAPARQPETPPDFGRAPQPPGLQPPRFGGTHSRAQPWTQTPSHSRSA